MHAQAEEARNAENTTFKGEGKETETTINYDNEKQHLTN
jgi:hypothetical protein